MRAFALSNFSSLFHYSKPPLLLPHLPPSLPTSGANLEHASLRLRDDEDTVLLALRSERCGFQYASDRVRACATMAEAAATVHHGSPLMYILPDAVSDEDMVHRMLEANGGLLEYLRVDSIRADPRLVRAAITSAKSGRLLRHASEELRSSRDFFLSLPPPQQGEAFVHTTLLDDEELARSSVEYEGGVLKHLNERLRDDTALVRAAARQSGGSVQYASERCRDDAVTMRLAVRSSWHSFQYATERLRSDADFVLDACKTVHWVLQYVPTLTADAQFMTTATEAYPAAYEYASPTLRGDAAFAISCLSRCGAALQHASMDLQDDPDVVRSAVTNSASALRYASLSLRDDETFMLEILAVKGMALEYASKRLQRDYDVVLTAVANDAEALRIAVDTFFVLDHENIDTQCATIFLAALKQNTDIALRYAPASALTDRALLLPLLAKDGSLLKRLPTEMRCEEEICLAAVSSYAYSLQHCVDPSRAVVLAAVSRSGECLRYAEAFQSDTAICCAALKRSSSAMKYCAFRGDPAFVLTAMEETGVNCLSYADDVLRQDHTFLAKEVLPRFGAMTLRLAGGVLREAEFFCTVIRIASEANNPDNGTPEEETHIAEEADAKKKKKKMTVEQRHNTEDETFQEIVSDAIGSADYSLRNDAAFFTKLFSVFETEGAGEGRPILQRFAKRYALLLLPHASSNVREDREFMGTVVARCPGALRFASEELRGDEGFVLSGATVDGSVVRYASSRLRRDKSVGMRCVARDGMALEYLEDNLRNDVEVVRCALRASVDEDTPYGALKFIKFKLQNDQEFAAEMVAADPHNLQYFPSFQSYRDIVLSAVKADYTAMLHAGRSLRSQKSFILSAIKEAGTYKVLYHAAQSFMDSNIPLYVSSIISKKISIREVGHLLESSEFFKALFQSTAGWSDREYLLTHCTATARCLDAKFVLRHNIPLRYLHHTQRDNEEFMLHLVQKDGLHLRHASKRIRDIHTIVFAAVQTTGLALRFASTALQKDAKIVCAAVSTDGMALQYVIGGCHGAVEAALKENGAAVQFVEEVTKEMAVLAVTHTCTALGYVGDVFCDDEDVVVAAVSQCGALLHLASKRLQACESVVRAAVVKGGGCGAGGHPDVVEQVVHDVQRAELFTTAGYAVACTALCWCVNTFFM